MAAPTRQLPASTGVVASTSGDQKLYGWSLHESDGTPAVASVVFTDSNGDIVGVVELAANGSSSEWFGPQGVLVRGDLTATITGTVEGAVFVG